MIEKRQHKKARSRYASGGLIIDQVCLPGKKVDRDLTKSLLSVLSRLSLVQVSVGGRALLEAFKGNVRENNLQ